MTSFLPIAFGAALIGLAWAATPATPVEPACSVTEVIKYAKARYVEPKHVHHYETIFLRAALPQKIVETKALKTVKQKKCRNVKVWRTLKSGKRKYRTKRICK